MKKTFEFYWKIVRTIKTYCIKGTIKELNSIYNKYPHIHRVN